MPTFNLIDESWVPCVTKSGGFEHFGIHDVFRNAHEIEQIRGETPLITAALYRFLIAVAHRIVGGPRDDDHWLALWQEGRFDPKAVDDYLDHWHERFDLFHPERPFYQVAGFAVVDGKENQEKLPFPLNSLLHEMAAGSNATLFDHNMDDEGRYLGPQEAAQRLITVQNFAVGGGKGGTSNLFGEHPYLGSALGLGGLSVFLKGPSLFDTFLMNLLSEPDWPVIGNENDCPSWERSIPPRPEKRMPDGYLDYLTLQPRIVRFVSNEENQVCGMYMAQGESLSRDIDIRGPFTPYHFTKKGDVYPVNLQIDRALWRDSHALLVQAKEDLRPAVVRQWERLLFLIPEPPEFTLCVVGLVNDQAKLLAWRQEELPVPETLLADHTAAEQLEKGLETAENVGATVAYALKRLAIYVLFGEGHVPKGKENDAIRKLTDRSTYWVHLEPEFYDFLFALPENPGVAYEEWVKTCKHVARQAFNETADIIVGVSARDLKLRSQAGNLFFGSLGKIS